MTRGLKILSLAEVASTTTKYRTTARWRYPPCFTCQQNCVVPLTLYKSTTASVYLSWCMGGTDGAMYTASKLGWFYMEKLILWFKQVREWNIVI
jgi:hypothetical protein